MKICLIQRQITRLCGTERLPDGNIIISTNELATDTVIGYMSLYRRYFLLGNYERKRSFDPEKRNHQKIPRSCFFTHIISITLNPFPHHFLSL